MAKSKAEILALAKREYMEVDGFRLQSLTDLELSDLRFAWGQRADKNQSSFSLIRAELVGYSLVDDEGKRIFSDEEFSEISQLPSAVVTPLYEACRELNGMDLDDEEDIEEQAKKSEETGDS